jgi:hypothetical protein
MKLPLFTLGLATALLSAAAVVGCSEPDVSGFEGGGSAQRADDDDDDATSKTKKSSKKSKDSTNSKTGTGTTGTASTTPSTSGTATTTPAPTKPTPQQCFTHCVSPVPEAVALDACTQKCADNDTDCLGDCYTTSNCGANPLCDQAVSQCGEKCPQTP